MKNQIKILSILFLFTPTLQLSMESPIKFYKEFLAQQKPASNFEHSLNKHLGQYINLPISSVDASDDTKLLWNKAQDALNIPKEFYLPVEHFSESSLLSIMQISGLCTVNKMYIHPNFSQYSMGVQQFIMYHEGTHHKYLDATKANFLNLGIIASAFVASKKISNMFTHGKRWYVTTLRLVGSWGLARIFSHSYTKQMEHRADLNAANTLKCHICLDEYIQALPPQNEIERTQKGYLSLDKFKAIAKEQKQSNDVCAQHKI